MALNVGPSHPTTHGVLRLIMELNGDLIDKCEPVLGYLHRGDEKIAENMTYNQFVPYTDRLDYLAPLANNVAYALTVEKLANLEVPDRCKAIRVLVCEMARISSHLLGMGVFGMDAGAWTPFMYTFTEREKLYTLFEELTGARFTTSYTRIGGVARDVPEGWLDRVEKFVDQLPKALSEVEKLLTRNRIFLDRTEGIGVISKDDALAYGLTGPNLRASGVDLDLSFYQVMANYAYNDANSVTFCYSKADVDLSTEDVSVGLDIDKWTVAHNAALANNLALVAEFSRVDLEEADDADEFAVELLYTF